MKYIDGDGSMSKYGEECKKHLKRVMLKNVKNQNTILTSLILESTND